MNNQQIQGIQHKWVVSTHLNKNCQWESIDFQASKLNTIEPNQSTIFVDSHSFFF